MEGALNDRAQLWEGEAPAEPAVRQEPHSGHPRMRITFFRRFSVSDRVILREPWRPKDLRCGGTRPAATEILRSPRLSQDDTWNKNRPII